MKDSEPNGVTINHKPKRKLASLRGLVKYVAPDFDAPLDDFFDYETIKADSLTRETRVEPPRIFRNN